MSALTAFAMTLAFSGAIGSLALSQPTRAIWFALAGLVAAIVGRPR